MSGSKPKRNEDRAAHSIRRTRVILEACEAIAQDEAIGFLDLDLEGKKAWLQTHMAAVIERSIKVGGADFLALREFNVFIVENEGAAVLYFERR